MQQVSLLLLAWCTCAHGALSCTLSFAERSITLHSASSGRRRLATASMIFPTDPTLGGYPVPEPQSRNSAMADLLGDLIDATDDETMVGALLSSATPMLMRPFIGIPEPGSIYGTAESTLSEKAAAYRTAMEERVGRARGSGNGERQALALERLSAHVLAEVAKLQRENLRLVCCDVDGTLLTPEHTVTPKTVEVVLRAMESVTFACCTGRGRFGAYNALGPIGEKLRERNAPGVFLNGLLVYGPDGEIVCEEVLPSAVVLDAAAFAATHELSLVGFTGERIVCSAADQWTDVFETIKEPKAEALHLPWEEIVKAERLNKLILLGEPSTLSSLRSALSGAPLAT